MTGISINEVVAHRGSYWIVIVNDMVVSQFKPVFGLTALVNSAVIVTEYTPISASVFDYTVRCALPTVGVKLIQDGVGIDAPANS